MATGNEYIHLPGYEDEERENDVLMASTYSCWNKFDPTYTILEFL